MWAAGWDESADKYRSRAYWNNKAIEVHPGRHSSNQGWADGIVSELRSMTR